MIINSDWHIHSEASYDASLPLEVIVKGAKEAGFKKIGITDHVNYNDDKFLADFKKSVESVKEIQKTHPEVVLGVELTPIAKPEYDYIAKTGTREGFVQPILDKPYEIELPLTLEELKANGVKYAVGASHWRVDYPDTPARDVSMNAVINECFRQQMWLACDKRVTILGHPWYNSRKLWFHDFSLIPHSMNLEIGAALKENKKYVECNSGYLFSPAVSEKYRMQYVEFIRELFEMGVPVTHGSDSHHQYLEHREKLEQCLKAVGFKDGEFSEIKEADFWG